VKWADRIRPVAGAVLQRRRSHWLLSRGSDLLQWIGSRELLVLVVLCAVMTLAWGFVELADEVADGETGDFDRWILLSMRSSGLQDPIGPGWVEEMGRDFTALGSMAVLSLVTLAVIGYLVLTARRHMAVVVLVATLGAMGVSTMLKNSYDRPRPDLVPHSTTVYTASFPSGHAMLAASTYLTLGALLARSERKRRVKAYILLVAVTASVIVGISRVYLGVHWPTDVLAGWAAGSGWALLCWLMARQLQEHGKVEAPLDG